MTNANPLDGTGQTMYDAFVRDIACLIRQGADEREVDRNLRDIERNVGADRNKLLSKAKIYNERKH